MRIGRVKPLSTMFLKSHSAWNAIAKNRAEQGKFFFLDRSQVVALPASRRCATRNAAHEFRKFLRICPQPPHLFDSDSKRKKIIPGTLAPRWSCSKMNNRLATCFIDKKVVLPWSLETDLPWELRVFHYDLSEILSCHSVRISRVIASSHGVLRTFFSRGRILLFESLVIRVRCLISAIAMVDM